MSSVVLVLAATWVAVIGGGFFDRTTRVYVSDIGTAAAALLAAWACYRASRRLTGRIRFMWILVALSAFSWGCGQVVWSWYELVRKTAVPFPSAADVGFLAAVPFAIVAMLVFPRAGSSVAGRVRALVDGLIVALSVLITSWVFVLGPVFRSGGTTLEHAIGLAYPIGDIVVITIVLYVLLLRERGHQQLLLPAMIGTAFVAMACSDSAFTYMTGKGDYATGTLADAGWLVGFAILAIAALRQWPVGTTEDSARPRGRLLPYLAVGVALVTSAVAQASLDASAFLSWVRTALIAALVVRQTFMLLENSSLTRRLEQRVRELRRSEQRFEALALHSSDVITIVGADGVVRFQSGSIQRVFGYAPEEVVGRPITALARNGSAAELESAMARLGGRDGAVEVVELEIGHVNGRVCNAETTITNLLANPAVMGIVLNTQDITERKLLERQLVHEASHDALTRLANRSLFRARVEDELRRNDSQQARLTILFIDLDGFKEVNDSLGHATGDRPLIQVAERIQASVRPTDVVARLGGDEFAVLVADQSDERDGRAVAGRITEALRQPFVLEGRQIHVAASIGIAATDHEVEDADHLLRNADLAMYRAKSTGDGYERYHPRLHAAAVERLQLETELHQAIAEDQLELHFQPTVSLADADIVGFEALARWKHPIRGYISPAEFIPLAEQTGAIRELGRWGLKEACMLLAGLDVRRASGTPLTVSVNISGRHLEDAGLIDDVYDALAVSGLSPSRLVLEMTESVLMAHTEENVELLGRLKALGVALAIDDFGTGYSSLAYLHRFPADVIKVDRSFVERLGGSESDTELLRTIVQLGQSLRMVTVAEGVESAEQVAGLQAMGCELAQGFYFHRPMPAHLLEELLAPVELKPVRGRAAA